MSTAIQLQNPFPGLRPFKAEEATLFFGRDEQIGEALDRLLRQKMLAVVGVSGCGKSSLISAGMVPALEMGLAGDPDRHWRVVVMRPGDGPLRELARCLDFGETLAARTYGLLEAVEAHLPAEENLLLVVDQFEEIFPFRDRKLEAGAGSEADLFISYLLRAAQDSAGRVYVLLTMRSDYLGECAKFHGLPEALNDGQYLVPRMTRQQLQQAIEGPLEAAAVSMHPALVQDLSNRCDEEPDNLPLLQHLLRRMFEEWESEGGRSAISSDMANRVGGLTGALNQDAERVCSGLTAEELRIAEVLFRRITESRRQADREEDDRPVRKPQTVAHLADLAQVEPAALRAVVERFEQRGLLVVRRTDQGDKVDLPHECICLSWTRLKEWIRAEADDAKKLKFLWHATERRALLAGLALDEAVRWAADGRLQAAWCARYLSGEQIAAVVAWVGKSQRVVRTAEEKERLAAEAERRRHEDERIQAEKESLREAERRADEKRERWTRLAALLFGLMSIAFCALGLWAYQQSKKAEDARQGAVASEKEARNIADSLVGDKLAHNSDTVFRGDQLGLERAALLAIESIRLRPSSDGDQALRQALSLLSQTQTVWQQNAARLVVFSQDGRRVAMESAGAVRVLDSASGNQVAQWAPASPIQVMALSEDGEWLATGGEDKTARLIDLATAREVAKWPRDSDSKAIAFGNGGKWIAIGDADRTIRVVDVETGTEVARHESGGDILSLALSPKGKWLAVITSSPKALSLIDISTGKKSLLSKVGILRQVSFSPDEKLIATAGADRYARVFQADDLEPQWEFKHQDKVQAISFSGDGRFVGTGSDDKTARVIDAASGKELVRMVRDAAVSALAFSPDGQSLETVDSNGTARFTKVPEQAEAVWPLTVQQEANALAFSADGKWLATGSIDGKARLWDTAAGKVVYTFGPFGGEVSAVAVSADGQSLMLVASGTRHLIDIASGGDRIAGPVGDAADTMAVSPDGKAIAVGGPGGVFLLDAATGAKTRTITRDPAFGVAFNTEGKLLVTGGGNGTARLWQVADGNLIRSIDHPNQRVFSTAFSSDGKWLATGGGNTIKVTEMTGGTEMYRIEIGEGIFAAAHFSKDNRQLETIYQVSETDKDLVYTRYLLDTKELIRETCQKLSRNLTFDEWKRYRGDAKYRRTCDGLPVP